MSEREGDDTNDRKKKREEGIFVAHEFFFILFV